MSKEDLAVVATEGLQEGFDGMPEPDRKVSFNGTGATIDADVAVELGQAVKFTGVGYLKHLGVDWVEGEEGKRPIGVVQVTSMTITSPS